MQVASNLNSKRNLVINVVSVYSFAQLLNDGLIYLLPFSTMTSNDNAYVCTLDEKSLKRAKEELKEDPKNRLGAVETFRKWILEQSHIKCPTGLSACLPTCLRYEKTRFEKLAISVSLRCITCHRGRRNTNYLRNLILLLSTLA